jgi:hypothetical protein
MDPEEYGGRSYKISHQPRRSGFQPRFKFPSPLRDSSEQRFRASEELVNIG